MPSNAYNLGRTKRQPLTLKNLKELNIDWPSLLNHPSLVYVDNNGTRHKPIGLSVNKQTYGTFPASLTAFKLGWIAYMDLGAPLIEERCDIAPPPPDMCSSRTYVNRSQTSKMTFTDSVDFNVSNDIKWSLQADAKLTFGGNVSAQLQLQLQNQLRMDLQEQMQAQCQNEVANKNANTLTNKNSKDSVGADNANTTENAVRNAATNSVSNAVTESVGFTTTGSATGTAGLNASLALGIQGSVSGSLSTSWASKSQISGEVPPAGRVETLVTQRRCHKHYHYEIPVTFSGFIAVHYAVPVAVLTPPQPGTYPGLAQTVARPISILDLTGGGFHLHGLAEVISVLDVLHTMFDSQSLTDSDRTQYKQP
ncbi:hypothetical protein GCM10018980_76320 [Streptomyces capoamus]|uniref:Uncharacterized protein n=1 Tax=Streptomyces capoamus TaxID=68183 RepID=A0A919KG95_9ACTN|nr:hypothetical protein [Streptomyces capoamus]GGW13085.1 hypothetical protein GCM10010501_15210 [Streptomyces libani subsp. rufus]GHG77780.1 hypothetical protein GCM10018980_76320 [Streptomyces capoamus]